jgi:hypothetical protein
MRNILLILGAIVTVVVLSGCANDVVLRTPTTNATQPSKDKLIGDWVGNDGNKTAEFRFAVDGTFVFILDGEPYGNGWKMTYTIDTNMYPWEVDCSAQDLNDKHINTVRMLVEMINDSTIRSALGDNTRMVPKHITVNNSMTLIRQK